MAQYLKNSGLSLILATLAVLVAALLLLSCVQAGTDREVLYARAVDDILLAEYSEAAAILEDLGGYKDSPLLLGYLQSRAAYVAGEADTAGHLRTLCALQEQYDGVLAPLFYSEMDAIRTRR